MQRADLQELKAIVLTAMVSMSLLPALPRESNPVFGNYFWVKPIVTNGIGTVAGDVGPVCAMRYEDSVFLSEALVEREKLSVGFDNENQYIERRQASTNAENVVGPFIDNTYFSRSVYGECYVETNQSVITSPNWATNVVKLLNPGDLSDYVFLTNVVTQTMKDGSVDMFSEARSYATNLWQTTHPYSVPISWLNMHELCISNGIRDIAKSPLFFTVMYKDEPYNIYSAEGIMSAYKLVRSMRIGWPKSLSTTPWKENNPAFNSTTYRRWSSNSLNTPSLISESTTKNFGEYYWFRSFSETDNEQQAAKWDEATSTWVLGPREFSQQISRNANSVEPSVASFIITTRLPEAIETDYGWCPIKKMNVFLLAEITYHLTTAISHTGKTSEGEEGTINENKSSNIVVRAAIPIQTVTRESAGADRMIRFSVTARGITSSLESVMLANRIPLINHEEFPPDLLRFNTGERIKLYPDHGLNTWRRTGSITTQERISTGFKIGYVPEFKPRTVLGSWTEYL